METTTIISALVAEIAHNLGYDPSGKPVEDLAKMSISQLSYLLDYSKVYTYPAVKE